MEAAVAAVHQQLQKAGVPHAFGGAFALACYGVPRPTRDIDVNVFVPTEGWPEVRSALAPLGVDVEVNEKELRDEDQVRLSWNPSSLHLFFSCDPLHVEMERHTQRVSVDGDPLPIVSPEHLIIRKALLNRTKDWLDIEQILAARSPLNLQEMESWMERLAGIDDLRLAKLRARLAS